MNESINESIIMDAFFWFVTPLHSGMNSDVCGRTYKEKFGASSSRRKTVSNSVEVTIDIFDAIF